MMGILERRKREKQELRAKILDAARDMFARSGYEAVTMRKLAKAIEYSPTAIYLHFKDKEALVHELCINDLSVMDETFQKLNREYANPVDRIQAGTLAFIDFARSHPAQYQVVFMLPKPKRAGEGEHPLAAPYQHAYDHLRETFDELIKSDKLQNQFQDADLVTQIYFCGLHGIISNAIGSEECLPDAWQPPERQAEYFVKVLLAGLIKP